MNGLLSERLSMSSGDSPVESFAVEPEKMLRQSVKAIV